MASGIFWSTEMVTFVFKNMSFTVKRSEKVAPGQFIYRHSDHLGGPWSVASISIANKNLDSQFRRLLKAAVNSLQHQEM